jgi:hypothetical protein
MVLEDGLDYAGMEVYATAMKFAGRLSSTRPSGTPQIGKPQFPVFQPGVAPLHSINHYRSPEPTSP